MWPLLISCPKWRACVRVKSTPFLPFPIVPGPLIVVFIRFSYVCGLAECCCFIKPIFLLAFPKLAEAVFLNLASTSTLSVWYVLGPSRSLIFYFTLSFTLPVLSQLIVLPSLLKFLEDVVAKYRIERVSAVRYCPGPGTALTSLSYSSFTLNHGWFGITALGLCLLTARVPSWDA